LETGAALIRGALDLLDNPQELYRQTTDAVRRQLNQVFFNRLYLDTDEVTDDRLALPFSDFLYQRSPKIRSVIHTRVHSVGTQNSAYLGAAGGISAGAALLGRISLDRGSSKAAMVELRGLEPLTFSLRRLHLVGSCARCGRLSVHYVLPDHGCDVPGHTCARFAADWAAAKASGVSRQADARAAVASEALLHGRLARERRCRSGVRDEVVAPRPRTPGSTTRGPRRRGSP
jgi:hypothetical protein